MHQMCRGINNMQLLACIQIAQYDIVRFPLATCAANFVVTTNLVAPNYEIGGALQTAAASQPMQV